MSSAVDALEVVDGLDAQACGTGQEASSVPGEGLGFFILAGGDEGLDFVFDGFECGFDGVREGRLVIEVEDSFGGEIITGFLGESFGFAEVAPGEIEIDHEIGDADLVKSMAIECGEVIEGVVAMSSAELGGVSGGQGAQGIESQSGDGNGLGMIAVENQGLVEIGQSMMVADAEEEIVIGAGAKDGAIASHLADSVDSHHG